MKRLLPRIAPSLWRVSLPSAIVVALFAAACSPAQEPPSTTSSSSVSTGTGTNVEPPPPTLSGIFTGPNAQHACAHFSDGSVRCWGYNASKQVGVVSGEGWPRQPMLVLNISRVVQGTAGGEHTCVLFDDDKGACWGSNGWGQLGNGEIGGGGLTPQPIVTLSTIKNLSNRCALLTDGTVYWWGNLAPGGVSGTPGKVDGLADVTSISCGTASCAVMKDGTLECWGGSSEDGVLGDGTTTPRLNPEPVLGLSGVAEAASGPFHACARLNDGTVQCWGSNLLGALGDGTKISRSVPGPVPGLTRLVGWWVGAGTAARCWKIGRCGAGEAMVTVSWETERSSIG